VNEFVLPVRVYYEDTDTGGVVYYANYLKFMERARTEWLRSLGFEQDRLMAEENLIFAVRQVQAEYLRPARFNDLLQVTARVLEHRGASIRFAQEVRRGEELLCRGEVGIVSLTADEMKPRRIARGIAERLVEIEHAS